MSSISRVLDQLQGQLRDGVMQDRRIAARAREAANDVEVTEEHQLLVHRGPPASEAELDELAGACQRICGFALPSDLRTFYRRHDGLWTSLQRSGDAVLSTSAPADGCVVPVRRLLTVLEELRDLMPKSPTRILPFHPNDDIRWHGYMEPSRIAYFSLEMEEATLARDLGEWLQLWIDHGFSDWRYELEHEPFDDEL